MTLLSRARANLVRFLRAQRAIILHRKRLPQPSRQYFAHLIDGLGLRGQGVEVGVAEAGFSDMLLRYTRLSRLYSVDAWREFPPLDYEDRNNISQAAQDARYEAVQRRLQHYGSRSVVLRAMSLDAATRFAGDSLDLVYIDANHSYEAVRQDLEAWWPAVRSGGVFAGHDYLDEVRPGFGVFGVQRAVDEFCNRHRQEVLATKERWPTWYVVKRREGA